MNEAETRAWCPTLGCTRTKQGSKTIPTQTNRVPTFNWTLVFGASPPFPSGSPTLNPQLSALNSVQGCFLSPVVRPESDRLHGNPGDPADPGIGTCLLK